MSINYLEKALEASPNDGRLILELDHMYIANDNVHERTELYRAYEQTVRKDDDLVLRWVDLLIHQQAFELDADLMDKIIHHIEKLKNETSDADEQDDNKQPKAISHYILSRIYEFQGKGKEAEEHFSKASSLNAEVMINTRLQATFVPAVDM